MDLGDAVGEVALDLDERAFSSRAFTTFKRGFTTSFTTLRLMT